MFLQRQGKSKPKAQPAKVAKRKTNLLNRPRTS